MEVFRITPAQFTYLVAAYGIAAGVCGLVGGFFLDRFDRKRSLVVLYAGFGDMAVTPSQGSHFFQNLIARPLSVNLNHVF